MDIRRNDPCPCGSGKRYKHCCSAEFSSFKIKHINAAHEWMDTHILKGSYPDLYGFLILVEHSIPPGEIWNQLKHWSEQYLVYGSDRTQRFHEIIDEEIKTQMALDIQNGYRPSFCYKGCSHCCCQPIACTDEESQLIHAYCADKKIEVDYDKLRRQLNFIQLDSNNDFVGETTWDDQPDEDQSCVFLNKADQTCMIWSVRPFVCRSHLAEKTNEYCRSHNGVPNPKASGIHYLTCSYILSAVFTIHHNSIGKMMGRLLLDLEKL